MVNSERIIERPEFPAFLNHRVAESHKGDYGHALLIAGSYGKMGAAVLAARAALRMGAGLLTVHVPRRGVEVMQIALPEAMVSIDEEETHWTHHFSDAELARYDAVAIGPGLGTDTESIAALEALLKALHPSPTPVVIDADGLNMLARGGLLPLLRRGMVLTPHDKEYARLLGDTDTAEACRQYGVTIVRKGHRTKTFDTEGNSYVNTTGNPGMATAGSGDVLTGIILGIMAQNKDCQLDTRECATLGVWIHGKSGDLAVEKQPQCTLVASDIIKNISEIRFD